MALYIILCIICGLSLASADEKDATILTKTIPEMSDREMMEFMMTRISRLETDKIRQEKRIVTLEDTVLRQNEVIKSLQKVLEGKGFDEDIKAETGDTDNSEHESAFDRAVKQQSKRENPRMQPHLMRKVDRTRRQVSARPVAFSSLLTHNLDHLGVNQDIAFDRTYVNTNSAYNPNHGVFTVPVPGVYVITATVLAGQNREVWADITVNGAVKALIYARGTDNRHDQGTQTILLHLKTSDDVSIKNEALDDSVHGGLYTTFSGFLLYEEGQAEIVG